MIKPKPGLSAYGRKYLYHRSKLEPPVARYFKCNVVQRVALGFFELKKLKMRYCSAVEAAQIYSEPPGRSGSETIVL